MLDKIFKFFSEKTEQPKAKEPKTSEIGWDSSAIYGPKDFHKWNPDDLIGRKGIAVYNAMLLDDQVKASSEFKKYACLAKSFYFDTESEDEAEKEQFDKIAEFFYFVTSHIAGNFYDKLLNILTSLQFGFSISEKIYHSIDYDGKQMWTLKDIKLRPHDTFQGGFITDNYGNVIKITQEQGASWVEIPKDKVIHFVHQEFIDRHYGQSDLRVAYRYYWAKDVTIKFANIHLERMAGGFIHASYEEPLSDEDETNLKAVINNISSKMGAMLPKRIELKLFPAVQTDAFDKAIERNDKAISKSLLVPNLLGLSQQGEVGSLARSQTEENTFFMVTDLIDSRLEDCLNENVFKELALWNFGTEKFPPFRFEKLSPEKKKQLSAAWADLISKGAVTKSENDEKWLRNILGAPEKSEDAEEQNKIPPQGSPPPQTEADIEAGIGGLVPASQLQKQQQPIPKNQKNMAEGNSWVSRVNFNEIKKSLDTNDEKFATDMANIMGQIKDAIYKQISKIVGQRSLGNVKINEFNALSIPKKYELDLKTVMKSNLSRVIDEQYNLAKKELPIKKHAEKMIGPGMDITQIDKFYRSKSDFWITSILNKDVLGKVQQALVNGIKYDKSLKKLLIDLDEDPDLAAVFPVTDAAGRAVNKPARIENIIRTNTADAMNAARTSLFSQEEYKGFISAFEYSAILDDGTTEICDTLNRRIRKDWGEYTPPNHYQCRSLLLPVTIIDDWDGKQDIIPGGIVPQKGFH